MARQYTRRGVLKTAALSQPLVKSVETYNPFLREETPYNFQLTFDRPVRAATAARYIAEVYKRASRDNSVRSTVPCDSVRDDDDLYAVVDGSLRCALFETGSWHKQPPRKTHWIHQYHARDSERNLLIKSLRKKKAKF